MWRNENTVGANHITQTSQDKSQQNQAPTMGCYHNDRCQDNLLPQSDAKTSMALSRQETRTDKRGTEEFKVLKVK